MIPATALGKDAARKAFARNLFIVDSNYKLQMSMTYPTTTGRNFNEILRTIDALQVSEAARVATPANWRTGEDVVILPEVTEDEAATLFPKGFVAIKPYLRITAQPSTS